MKGFVALWAIYIVGGFATFGYAYHYTGCALREYARTECAAFTGAYWPIYWPGKVTIEVFKP